MAQNAEELRRLLDALVAAGAPGAAARVDDEIEILRVASGVADVRTGRPMGPALRFRAGSVTKSFVAAVVLQLADEGRLSLDDTLERWLPGIVPYAREVSLLQLLGHTSGMPDHIAALARIVRASESERLRAWTPRELVALTRGEPLRFTPGTAWSYSNTGYILLGLVIEAATGSTLAAELDRRIISPLDLASTSFPVDSFEVLPPMARGYGPALNPAGEIVDGPLVDLSVMNPSWAWAAGALVSNLDDLAMFFHALFGARLFHRTLVAEMSATIEVPASALPLPLFDRAGLGIVEVDTPAGRLLGQPGGIAGYLNMVLCTQDGRRQLAIVVNIGELAPPRLNEALIAAIRTLGEHLVR